MAIPSFWRQLNCKLQNVQPRCAKSRQITNNFYSKLHYFTSGMCFIAKVSVLLKLFPVNFLDLREFCEFSKGIAVIANKSTLRKNVVNFLTIV